MLTFKTNEIGHFKANVQLVPTVNEARGTASCTYCIRLEPTVLSPMWWV